MGIGVSSTTCRVVRRSLVLHFSKEVRLAQFSTNCVETTTECEMDEE